jgi:hypothetical protein
LSRRNWHARQKYSRSPSASRADDEARQPDRNAEAQGLANPQALTAAARQQIAINLDDLGAHAGQQIDPHGSPSMAVGVRLDADFNSDLLQSGLA